MIVTMFLHGEGQIEVLPLSWIAYWALSSVRILITMCHSVAHSLHLLMVCVGPYLTGISRYTLLSAHMGWYGCKKQLFFYFSIAHGQYGWYFDSWLHIVAFQLFLEHSLTIYRESLWYLCCKDFLESHVCIILRHMWVMLWCITVHLVSVLMPYWK